MATTAVALNGGKINSPTAAAAVVPAPVQQGDLSRATAPSTHLSLLPPSSRPYPSNNVSSPHAGSEETAIFKKHGKGN